METTTTMNTTPETETKVETKAPQTAEEWKADASRKLLALELAVDEYKAVVNTKDYDAIKDKLGRVNLALAGYNGSYKMAVYAELAESENPMKAAVEYGYLKCKRVKEVVDRDTGMIGVEINDATVDKRNVLNLIEFTRFTTVKFNNASWPFACNEFARVISMDTMAEHTMSAEEQKEFNEAYAEKKESGQLVLKSVEKMKAGATVSNNDLITDIQSIFDAILMIPVENKKGETVNAIKATSHELKFIMNRKSGAGKNARDTHVMGGTEMTQAIMNMMWNIASHVDEKGEHDYHADYTFSFGK